MKIVDWMILFEGEKENITIELLTFTYAYR